MNVVWVFHFWCCQSITRCEAYCVFCMLRAVARIVISFALKPHFGSRKVFVRESPAAGGHSASHNHSSLSLGVKVEGHFLSVMRGKPCCLRYSVLWVFFTQPVALMMECVLDSLTCFNLSPWCQKYHTKPLGNIMSLLLLPAIFQWWVWFFYFYLLSE